MPSKKKAAVRTTAAFKIKAVPRRTATAKKTRAAEDATAPVSALLREAAETHHRVYRIVEGEDPDWASWYADWLLHLSELPNFLHTIPVRSELIYALVKLDKDYNRGKPAEAWEPYYARELVRHFASRERLHP